MNLNRGEFRGQRLLQAPSYQQLWHPYQKTGTKDSSEFGGLGWFIDTYHGLRTIRHDGADVGFQSDMILLPDQSLAVIVLANTIPAPVKTVLYAIVDLLIGAEPTLPKPPVLVSLGTVLSTRGVKPTADRYRHLLESQADDSDFGLEQFFDVAYSLLEARRFTECHKVIRLGMELFPGSHKLTEFIQQIKSTGGSV
jgi:hypothetical protein